MLYNKGVILEDGCIIICGYSRAQWKRLIKMHDGKKCFSNPVVKQLIKDHNKEIQGK